MSTSIRNYQDLKPFGFSTLTGEACNYSMRMLCDINSDAQESLRDFFGVAEIQLHPAWNPGSLINDQEPVGCFMMPHNMFKDLSMFLLLRAGHDVVVETEQGGCFGYYKEEWEKYHKGEWYESKIVRRITPMIQGGGGRVQHAMSGRTV